MPVKKEPSGRRTAQAEAEVPGSPEEVWQAIATGPGISSWFVPSEVEEREGGRAVSHFGPGSSMDSVGTVTAWEPPHRFVVDTEEGGLTVGSEWTVEARDGGTCVVRVVHSWFASTDEWDGQFEQAEYGWVGFFRILRLVLTHFRGQPCSLLQLMGNAPEPKEAAWAALGGALGIAGAEVGQRVSTSPGAPVLAGFVERVGEPEHREDLLLVLDRPGPGLANLFAMPMGGDIYLSIRLFLFGEDGPATVARVEPEWQAWLRKRFPAASEEGPAAEGAPVANEAPVV